MRRIKPTVPALLALAAAALFTACAGSSFAHVRPDRRILVDADSGKPVLGATAEIVVHRRDRMEEETRATVQGDGRGRVAIPGKDKGLSATAAQFHVPQMPRGQAYWFRAPGYLSTYLDLWSVTEYRAVSPGTKIGLFPAQAAALPESAVFHTYFVERGDQSLFVPATATGGPMNLELLGVRGFLPLADVFEKAGCRKIIEEGLDGKTVRPAFDPRMGPFVEWPDSLAVYLSFDDGRDVGAWLIAEGLALSDFRFDHSLKAEYDRLEDEAARDGKGVWGVLKEIGKGDEEGAATGD